MWNLHKRKISVKRIASFFNKTCRNLQMELCDLKFLIRPPEIKYLMHRELAVTYLYYTYRKRGETINHLMQYGNLSRKYVSFATMFHRKYGVIIYRF